MMLTVKHTTADGTTYTPCAVGSFHEAKGHVAKAFFCAHEVNGTDAARLYLHGKVEVINDVGHVVETHELN